MRAPASIGTTIASATALSIQRIRTNLDETVGCLEDTIDPAPRKGDGIPSEDGVSPITL